MSWEDIVKKIPIPKETEGNYRGKEPATAEGRYGPQDNLPEAIAREMEERIIILFRRLLVKSEVSNRHPTVRLGRKGGRKSSKLK